MSISLLASSTILKKFKDHTYEEVIFNESFEPAPSRVMSLIHQSSESISKAGATPSYAIITPTPIPRHPQPHTLKPSWHLYCFIDLKANVDIL